MMGELLLTWADNGWAQSEDMTNISKVIILDNLNIRVYYIVE
jgi:hypothetical protein